jgi:hypothetical protein
MNKSELNRRLKGRSPDQKKVIKYFNPEGGCLSFLSSGLKDDEYEAMVMTFLKNLNAKQKGFKKTGVDESEVAEIDPVHFEGYFFDGGNYSLRGKDNIWRSSAYQITWIFFSSKQIYVYQYTFNMDEDGKKERTEEYFYKDITNFTTVSETVEVEAVIKKNCQGEPQYGRVNVDTNVFKITVPGEKFECAMVQNEYTERVIQGMKAKLREKKG